MDDHGLLVSPFLQIDLDRFEWLGADDIFAAVSGERGGMRSPMRLYT